MPNFVDDNLPLPVTKTDRFPPTNPSQQWTASDANIVDQALADLRTVAQRSPLNVKAFGALGDGATDDATAIQAALTAAAATVNGTFGVIVDVPKGTYLLGSQLTIPNGVGLRGVGPASTILRAKSTLSAASLIRNATQDGTQEYAFLESMMIDGNQGAGAVCSTAVVDLGSLFVNSYIRDVIIENGSNVGLHVWAGGTPGGMGPILIENTWVINNVGHNVLIEEVAGNSGAAMGICCVNLASEHQGSGKSALYLKGLGNAGQWNFFNLHIEMGQAGATTQNGITFDGVSHVVIRGLSVLGAPSTVSEVVKITTAIQNVGLDIGPIFNPNLLTPVIRDLKNSITVGAINIDGRYVTPESAVFGGQRFRPAGSSAVGAAFQDSAGVDRSWFNGSGQLTGESLLGAAIDVVGDTTNNRTIALAPNAGSGFTNKYWFLFPVGGGGVLRFSQSSGSDIFQVGTDGTIFFYQAQTFQSAVTLQSTLKIQGNVGFYNTAPSAKPTITGSRGGNAALASLLTGLAGLGLITDSTTA